MKTENELNKDILKTTMVIKEKYPELEKFIGEMPVTIPDTDDPEINNKSLTAYKESLEALVKKYAIASDRQTNS